MNPLDPDLNHNANTFDIDSYDSELSERGSARGKSVANSGTEPMQTAPETTTAIAPAQPDNRWRRGLRHGLRSRHLPFKGGKSIEKHRNQYRRAIEDELRTQGREIGACEATTVAAAVVAYEHALKAGFWLANNHDEMNHDQRLAFSREEMRGLAEAAKLLKSLGIDRRADHRDHWSTLDGGTNG